MYINTILKMYLQFHCPLAPHYRSNLSWCQRWDAPEHRDRQSSRVRPRTQQTVISCVNPAPWLHTPAPLYFLYNLHPPTPSFSSLAYFLQHWPGKPTSAQIHSWRVQASHIEATLGRRHQTGKRAITQCTERQRESTFSLSHSFPRSSPLLLGSF